MNLIIGQLFDIVRLETNDIRTFRVVGLVGPDAAWVWIIEIRLRKALPVRVSRDEVQKGINSGSWISVSGDNFPSSNLSEVDLTEAQKRAVDESWPSLDALLRHGDALFDSNQRWQITKRIATEYKISTRNLFRRLRRYWQRGMTRLSIMPDYYNCGQVKASRAEQGKKRGRKGHSGEGFVMSDDDVMRCRSGYKKYFLKDSKASLRGAYFNTLNEFYATSRLFDGTDYVSSLKPADERPTFAQFRWVTENQVGYAARTQARSGGIVYNKDLRPLRGRASDISFGPGHIYQIDATPWDITLVSRIKRVPIGKPTLYLVLDVFSHAVAGFHLCLEHAGYDPAAAALYCCITDKVKFAAQHGVTLENDDWPIQGLPNTIYADRGELIGLAVESACKSLRITMANTPPYRADMKPNVEASFQAINRILLASLQGYNRGYHRLQNPTKDAVLDIGQMTKLLIHAVNAYNRRLLRNYPIRIHEFGSSVPHVPHELWTWGIQNRGGSLRYCGDESLIPALLRRENALVTGRGLKFRGLFYGCDAEWMTDLQVRARDTKAIRIEVAYHEDCVSRVYLKPSQPGLPYVECELAQESAVFRDWTFAEVKDARKAQGQIDQESSDEYDNRRAKLEQLKKVEIEAGEKAARCSPDRLKIPNRSAVKDDEAKKERPKNALTATKPDLPPLPAAPKAGDLLLPKNDLAVFDALEMTSQ